MQTNAHWRGERGRKLVIHTSYIELELCINSAKGPGITVDSSLKISFQHAAAVKKSNDMLRRLRNWMVNNMENIRTPLYKSLVQSHLDTMCSTCCPLSKRILQNSRGLEKGNKSDRGPGEIGKAGIVTLEEMNKRGHDKSL